MAQCQTRGDELAVARCDLDLCKNYKKTVFDFERYRMPQHYKLITERRGAVPPPERTP